MKILYVTNVRPGSITERRIGSFRRLGHEVEAFDLAPYLARLRNPLTRRMAHKLDLGFVVGRINRDLRERARTGGYDLAFVAKGTLIHPETVSLLREMARSKICVHYSADPTLIRYRTRFFVRSVPEYTLCVTTKSYDMPLYHQLAPRDLLLVSQGYDPEMALPRGRERSELRWDVIFIGHAERHYMDMIDAVSGVTKSIAIWGAWEKFARKDARIRDFWCGGSVFGTDYARLLASGRLALGLVSQLHPDASTTRTFEIPAAGSFLLAERTDEHEQLFHEGVEAAFFGSSEELQERVEHYLLHPAEREEIAQRGQGRCLANYSNDDILATILARARMSTPGAL